jgi:hypothetical protein
MPRRAGRQAPTQPGRHAGPVAWPLSGPPTQPQAGPVAWPLFGSLDWPHAAGPGRTRHAGPAEWAASATMSNQLGVGDSPRGPLKQLGNPHLKPATKPKPNTPYLTMQDMAHAAEAPAAHQAAHSKVPSSRLHLARGCAPTSGGLRPVRGGAPPSSGLRLARGSAPPSNGARLVRGRSARAPAPVRGHLMP